MGSRRSMSSNAIHSSSGNIRYGASPRVHESAIKPNLMLPAVGHGDGHIGPRSPFSRSVNSSDSRIAEIGSASAS